MSKTKLRYKKKCIMNKLSAVLKKPGLYRNTAPFFNPISYEKPASYFQTRCHKFLVLKINSLLNNQKAILPLLENKSSQNELGNTYTLLKKWQASFFNLQSQPPGQ